MKTKYLLVAGVVLLAFILAGCTVEYDTKIQPDQSGTVTEAIGLSTDEMKIVTSQSTTDTGGVCNQIMKDSSGDSSSNLPSDAVVRQEQKGDETWCYIDMKFSDLDELRSIYSGQNVTVNRLEVVDKTFYYDVSLDSSSSSGMGYMVQMTWKVTMPGLVKSNNATSASGQTLTWDLSSSSSTADMQAESSLNSTAWIWWLAGGLLCLCLVVLVIVVVVVIVITRRNKKKKVAAPATPA